MTLNPRYGALGLVALPQVWLFPDRADGAGRPSPICCWSGNCWRNGVAYMQHGAEFSNDNLLTGGNLLLRLHGGRSGRRHLSDFLMEKRENWSLLWWLMLQRFGYRQLMYYVVVRSIRRRCAASSWAGQARTRRKRDGAARLILARDVEAACNRLW